MPANKLGKEVLVMLIEAFKQRKTFLVGTSQTTGQQNVVCWAGIHHKTSPYPGTFGWPDETYFVRVKDELEQRNVKLDLSAF